MVQLLGIPAHATIQVDTPESLPRQGIRAPEQPDQHRRQPGPDRRSGEPLRPHARARDPGAMALEEALLELTRSRLPHWNPSSGSMALTERG